MRFSQSFLGVIIKFLCSLESSFHVVLKNSLTFYDRTHMTKVMADESLSTIFFRHPVNIDKKIKMINRCDFMLHDLKQKNLKALLKI